MATDINISLSIKRLAIEAGKGNEWRDIFAHVEGLVMGWRESTLRHMVRELLSGDNPCESDLAALEALYMGESDREVAAHDVYNLDTELYETTMPFSTLSVFFDDGDINIALRPNRPYLSSQADRFAIYDTEYDVDECSYDGEVVDSDLAWLCYVIAQRIDRPVFLVYKEPVYEYSDCESMAISFASSICGHTMQTNRGRFGKGSFGHITTDDIVVEMTRCLMRGTLPLCRIMRLPGDYSGKRLQRDYSGKRRQMMYNLKGTRGRIGFHVDTASIDAHP